GTGTRRRQLSWYATNPRMSLRIPGNGEPAWSTLWPPAGNARRRPRHHILADSLENRRNVDTATAAVRTGGSRCQTRPVQPRDVAPFAPSPAIITANYDLPRGPPLETLFGPDVPS